MGGKLPLEVLIGQHREHSKRTLISPPPFEYTNGGSEPFSDMRKTISKDWNSPKSQFAMHLMQLKSGRGIKL